MSLFNLAYARATGGAFVLRIEDTDQARYVESSEQQIYDTLHWLGLDRTDRRPGAGLCAGQRRDPAGRRRRRLC